jgi:hypothetical protein
MNLLKKKQLRKVSEMLKKRISILCINIQQKKEERKLFNKCKVRKIRKYLKKK